MRIRSTSRRQPRSKIQPTPESRQPNEILKVPKFYSFLKRRLPAAGKLRDRSRLDPSQKQTSLRNRFRFNLRFYCIRRCAGAAIDHNLLAVGSARTGSSFGPPFLLELY